MSSQRYDLCGPTVRCEIELHLPEAAGDARVDIDVVWGDPTDIDEPPDGEGSRSSSPRGASASSR